MVVSLLIKPVGWVWNGTLHSHATAASALLGAMPPSNTRGQCVHSKYTPRPPSAFSGADLMMLLMQDAWKEMGRKEQYGMRTS